MHLAYILQMSSFKVSLPLLRLLYHTLIRRAYNVLLCVWRVESVLSAGDGE